jgi:predicted secreted hydrolase
LPPLNGFVSEFLIYFGSFRAVGGTGTATAGAALIMGLALIGGLAAACFTKAFGIVFLGEPRSGQIAAAHEAGWAMRIPMLLLAAATPVSDEYPGVVADHAIDFPRDAGAHPAYRSEWWYITSWLQDSAGAGFGVQVTFFRNRPRVAESNSSAFAPRQLLFAHAAIADPRHGRLRRDQRAAREGFGLAGAADDTTAVWIDDWALKLAGNVYVATVAARDFQFTLRFALTQGTLLQGRQGFSRKGPSLANASYYYSRPQLIVSGSVAHGDRVRRVSGIAWLDHEWSSRYLTRGAVGWDWIGINFDDGSALMAFRIRDVHGEALWAGGSVRDARGVLRVFTPDEIAFVPERRWKSPRTGITYPVSLRVRAGGLEAMLEPLFPDQELDARAGIGVVYWEGAVRALIDGRVAGRGYLELTGYGQPLRL